MSPARRGRVGFLALIFLLLYSSVFAASKVTRDAIAEIATIQEQGQKPYVWGAKGPDSFDCSGLVYFSYVRGGVESFEKIWSGVQGPGTSRLVEMSNPISGEFYPGDLVFLHGTYDKNLDGAVDDRDTYTHVGIYIGGDNIIHAGSPVQKAKLSEWKDDGKKKIKFAEVRRIKAQYWPNNDNGYVAEEAKQIAKTDTAVEKNSDSGFFSNLWKRIVNLFFKNDKNSELPAKVGDAVENALQGNTTLPQPSNETGAKVTQPEKPKEESKPPPPPTSEKVVRIIANNIQFLAANSVGKAPLGGMIGVAEDRLSDNTRWEDIKGVYLKRGDIVEYISEGSVRGNPNEWPQVTRAVEVKLPSGKKGWVVTDWFYKGETIVMAEVLSANDLSKQIPLAPSITDIKGEWIGEWTGQAGTFEIEIKEKDQSDRLFVGKGRDVIVGQMQSFTIGGATFKDKIFFDAYYSNDNFVKYEGTFSGNGVVGSWKSSGHTSGDWSMEKAPLSAQPKSQKLNSKTLAIQLASPHGVPVTSLIEKNSLPWGYMPSLYLLDAVGDEISGSFCSPKGCGFGSQYADDGIWEFTGNVPFGTYTLVFTEGECCGSSGEISRAWGGFKKEIHISNDNERFITATVETKGAKVPLYVRVKLVNQVGTLIDKRDSFPCFLIDKNGKKFRIDPMGFGVCSGYDLIATQSAPLSPGEYTLRLEKDGYLPFEKTISVPDVSAMNDSEARAKIPEVKGNLILIKNGP